MTKVKTTDQIKELTEKLLSLAGVNAEIEVVEKEEDTFEVNLSTPDETGLLIGFRGENINAIQTVLGIMLKGITGEWFRIIVNVGDYRQKQEEKLKELANISADRAIETNEPQPIYNLNASQRRVVHMHLAERGDVLSESQGEEPERYLVVKSK
ncbi:MAG: KH domain-containing protein [Candidatus Woesebacteria bacterium]|nr:KH domain-containing protein [Candidatus Woesebacteria bacterium]